MSRTGPNDAQPDPGSYARLEKVYERFRRDIYFFLLRSLREEATALDLMQETFVRFITSYRERHDLLADEVQCKRLLLRIARNALINHAESSAVKRVSQTDELDFPDHRSAEAVALRNLNNQDVQNLLDSALASLIPQDREVLLLHYDQNLSGKDVAAVLGITSGAVSRRLDRARRALRRVLEKRGVSMAHFRDLTQDS